MTLPQLSSLAHSIPLCIMDSTANLDTRLGTYCSSLCLVLVRGQVLTTLDSHNLLHSGGVHRFESRICKANPPPCAIQSFSCTGPIRHPTLLSLITFSWTKQNSPRNGLYLAPSCGRDVYHGCPTIVSLFPLQFPDRRLIWLGSQLAHIEFQRGWTLVDSTISFRLIKSSIYSLSWLLFRLMSVC